MSKAYEELIDYLVAETAPEKMIAFSPSKDTRARVWELVRREKAGVITPDEKTELDHFAHLAHLFRVTKARTYEHMGTTNFLMHEASLISKPRPRPRRGGGKVHISYVAADFDAPLEEMREYSEPEKPSE